MTFDPTTGAAWIVQGEEDVGPQRRCRSCRQWLPLEATCWRTVTRRISYVRPGRPNLGSEPLERPFLRTYYVQPCRDCNVRRLDKARTIPA